MTDRARGALLGLAVGDALGAPAEFYPPAMTINRYGGPLREMVGGGHFDLDPGETTDDTAMAVALAEATVESGHYDPDLTMEKYLQWYATDPPDVGNTCASALEGVKGGLTPRQATQQYHAQARGKSAGNGTIMRIAPLAIRYHDDPVELARVATAESHQTHYDPIASLACNFYCRLLAADMHDDPEPAVPGELEESFEADREYCAQAADDRGGFVLTALSVACCARRERMNYEEGVVWAVNLGWDADTNAAVTGALLGARQGLSAIPDRWLEALHGRDRLTGLADDLLAAS